MSVDYVIERERDVAAGTLNISCCRKILSGLIWRKIDSAHKIRRSYSVIIIPNGYVIGCLRAGKFYNIGVNISSCQILYVTTCVNYNSSQTNFNINICAARQIPSSAIVRWWKIYQGDAAYSHFHRRFFLLTRGASITWRARAIAIDTSATIQTSHTFAKVFLSCFFFARKSQQCQQK